MMRIYHQRVEGLRRLPPLFSMAELQAVLDLSKDAAWQTCRYWKDTGRVEQLERGIYRRAGVSLVEPEILHRLFCDRSRGYVTGCWALSRQGFIKGLPGDLDLLTTGVAARQLTWNKNLIHVRTLRVSGLCRGIHRWHSQGRLFRMASPERCLVDAIAHPGKLLEIETILEIMVRKKAHIRQQVLLDILLEKPWAALWRRARVLAELTPLKRLSKWMDQQQPESFHRVGRIPLDPCRPVSETVKTWGGVQLNAVMAAQDRLMGGSAGENPLPE